jgi:hypothetical protein
MGGARRSTVPYERSLLLNRPLMAALYFTILASRCDRHRRESPTRPFRQVRVSRHSFTKRKKDCGGKTCLRVQGISLLDRPEQASSSLPYPNTLSATASLWRKGLISETNSSLRSCVLSTTQPCAARLSHPTLARRVRVRKANQRSLTQHRKINLKTAVQTAACRRGWWC